MNPQVQSEPHVRIRGKVFLYRQKAPFVASGMSVRGALEYDPDKDLVRCHECGGWFSALSGAHLRKHGLVTREYKKKHGLNMGASLHNDAMRIASSLVGKATQANRSPDEKLRFLSPEMRQRGYRIRRDAGGTGTGSSYESRNERGTCHAQILNDIRQLAENLGRAPSYKELTARGFSVESALHLFNIGSTKELVSLAGLIPSHPGKYSVDILKEMLIDFYVKRSRIPTSADFYAKSLPSRSTYRIYFGSWTSACEAAGLGKIHREQTAETKRRSMRIAQLANPSHQGAQ